MPVELLIDKVKDLTKIKVSGEISLEGIMRTLQAFYRGRPTAYLLWDMSEGNVGSIQFDDLLKIVGITEQYVQTSRPGGKSAIIAPVDLVFGMANIIRGFCVSLPLEIAVFRTRREANKWLFQDP